MWYDITAKLAASKYIQMSIHQFTNGKMLLATALLFGLLQQYNLCRSIVEIYTQNKLLLQIYDRLLLLYMLSCESFCYLAK